MSHCTDYAKDHDTDSCAACAADLEVCIQEERDRHAEKRYLQALKAVEDWKARLDRTYAEALADGHFRPDREDTPQFLGVYVAADWLLQALTTAGELGHPGTLRNSKPCQKAPGKASDAP